MPMLGVCTNLNNWRFHIDEVFCRSSDVSHSSARMLTGVSFIRMHGLKRVEAIAIHYPSFFSFITFKYIWVWSQHVLSVIATIMQHHDETTTHWTWKKEGRGWRRIAFVSFFSLFVQKYSFVCFSFAKLSAHRSPDATDTPDQVSKL